MRLIATALTFATLPLTAGSAAAQTAPILPDGTVLDIVARGEAARVPDVATIRAGVVTQAPTAAAALSENAQRMARVLDALKRAGVAARDIATANVGLSPQYRYAENMPPAITGYQASNTVSVRFRDIARSGAILDTLVGQGANQIDGPSLAIDQPEAALDEARADAVRRARARAELYARTAGLSVARIVSIAESGDHGGGTPPPIMMMRAKAAAEQATEIAPGETDVTVTLAVRFLLR